MRHAHTGILGMKRRDFLTIVTAMAVLLSAPERLLQKVGRCVRVRLAQPGNYPGPIAPLDPTKVAKPGKWAG
jgi:hypothetical protein